MLAYLAGAIEYAPDLGRGWRREVAAFLKTLGHDVYDPAEDERKSLTEEAQFFDKEIVTVCNTLADMGKRVIVAGLDQDFMGRPFDPMPQLLSIAGYITKTLAICMRCGNPANHTQRLIASEERVIVGAADIYEARCRRCFEPIVAAAPEDREMRSAGVG